jgi:hypothetical protein
MNTTFDAPLKAAERFARSRGRRGLFLAAVCLSAVLGASDATAQYYRSFRPYGGVVVGPSVYPGAFYGAPWIAPSVVVAPRAVVGPPATVRIRTPFFALNVGPDVYYPPRYPLFDPLYGYGYDVYRPYSAYAVPRVAVPRYRDVPSLPGKTRGPYSAGAGGGIPDLTMQPRFSVGALRDAAESLRITLERRPDDGDIWLDFLRPGLVAAAADSGSPTPELAELLPRYDGVTMNPDLRHITRLRGFSQTRQLLSTWLERVPVRSAARDTAPIAPPELPSGQNDPSARQQSDDSPSDPFGGDQTLPAPTKDDSV